MKPLSAALLALSWMPPLVAVLLSTTTTGCSAGYYREKTGSLVPASAAHLAANVVGMMTPLLLRISRS
jgi:hypothetical protein